MQVRHRHAFVDLMHRPADEAELDHGTMVGDKSRVRRAAGRRQSRLAAGLFCSFFGGPFIGLKAIHEFPWLLTLGQQMFPNSHPLIPTVVAMTPFIAASGIVGFWFVAAGVYWFKRREGKDLGELYRDAKKDLE